ncbi:MAG TPA: hypothetical protein VJ729_08770 [Nitrososphaeraceae archaeon]|nr:hypothetical protein [Nitrososphaeraceae archaeon]
MYDVASLSNTPSLSTADLGISGSFGAYSNEVLASVFGMQTTTLAFLPKYQEDLFIVEGGSP